MLKIEQDGVEYRFVRYGLPKQWEWYLDRKLAGTLIQTLGDFTERKVAIFEPIRKEEE